MLYLSGGTDTFVKQDSVKSRSTNTTPYSSKSNEVQVVKNTPSIKVNRKLPSEGHFCTKLTEPHMLI